MRGQHIKPCVECRRDTPPRGETVCRRCQAAHEAEDHLRDLENRIYSLPDFPDAAVDLRAILRDMLALITGERL